MSDPTRVKMQELAAAAGVTLKDGSPVVVGGEKCPPTQKIIARLQEMGWEVRRMTKAQRSDAQDDYGFAGRHISNAGDLPADVWAIMQSDSGFADCDGPMTVDRYLLTSM